MQKIDTVELCLTRSRGSGRLITSKRGKVVEVLSEFLTRIELRLLSKVRILNGQIPPLTWKTGETQPSSTHLCIR